MLRSFEKASRLQMPFGCASAGTGMPNCWTRSSYGGWSLATASRIAATCACGKKLGHTANPRLCSWRSTPAVSRGPSAPNFSASGSSGRFIDRGALGESAEYSPLSSQPGNWRWSEESVSAV